VDIKSRHRPHDELSESSVLRRLPQRRSNSRRLPSRTNGLPGLPRTISRKRPVHSVGVVVYPAVILDGTSRTESPTRVEDLRAPSSQMYKLQCHATIAALRLVASPRPRHLASRVRWRCSGPSGYAFAPLANGNRGATASGLRSSD